MNQFIKLIKQKFRLVKRQGIPRGLAVGALSVALGAVLVGVSLTSPNDVVVAHADQPAEDQASALVTVHVCGAVSQVGVYQLPEKSRVGDAINAAGGFAQGADPSSLNLARVLVDGEQLYVRSTSEEDQAQGAMAAGQKINVNKATAAQLEKLPGVGESLAKKIVAYRDKNGSFSCLEDLTKVSGIGDKKLASFMDLVCV